MWTVCITSIRHVLKLNGYGGPQAKANEKRLRFKGWETLVKLKVAPKCNMFFAMSIGNRIIFGKFVPTFAFEQGAEYMPHHIR